MNTKLISFTEKPPFETLPVFKISCHAIGQIMTARKTKTTAEKIQDLQFLISETETKYGEAKEGSKVKINLATKLHKLSDELTILETCVSDSDFDLSETAKTYCDNWLKSRLYDKKKTFQSKYTDKGLQTEDDAIEYLCETLDWGFAVKNDVRKPNDFLNGECDVLLSDTVIDVKSSYDCFTFPLFQSEIPNTDYEFQLLGYMHLYNKKKAELIYVLMDMPEEMIRKEAFFKLGKEYTIEEYSAFEEERKYSHLPDYLRIKRFTVAFDSEKIEAIRNKVIECRRYIEFKYENL